MQFLDKDINNQAKSYPSSRHTKTGNQYSFPHPPVHTCMHACIYARMYTIPHKYLVSKDTGSNTTFIDWDAITTKGTQAIKSNENKGSALKHCNNENYLLKTKTKPIQHFTSTEYLKGLAKSHAVSHQMESS